MKEDHQDERPLGRLSLSILMALYKNDPIPMSEEEIEQFIYAEGLLQMTEEEFQKYGEDLIRWKDGQTV